MLPNHSNHKRWQYSQSKTDQRVSDSLSVGIQWSNIRNYRFGDFKGLDNGRIIVFDTWSVVLMT